MLRPDVKLRLFFFHVILVSSTDSTLFDDHNDRLPSVRFVVKLSQCEGLSL